MFKHCSDVLLYNVVVLIILATEIQCDYEQQPKIQTKKGSLILEAAYDRNISIRLSHGSTLYLNNVDVMEKIRQRSTPTALDGDTKHLDIPTSEQMKVEIQTLHDFLERLGNRLQTLLYQTRRTLNLRAIRRNLGRIRVLNGRYMALERLLLKDECAEAKEPCKNGGTCYDSYKDFYCECPEGYTGKTCEEDIDECYMLAGTDWGCQNNAQCINTPGSYKCVCAKGFTGSHCRLRHAICQQEQSQELCGHGFCVPANNQQGYTCICEQGWQQNTNVTNSSDLASLTCDVDVNECDETTNPCHSECINLPGSFKCGPCPGGYTGSGLFCYDIDECAVNNGGCSSVPKVRCINTEGSYRCGNCPTGWVGDGHLCELAPSNSCDAEKICHPQAKCEYISDIATCTCPPGMFGHGFGPQGCHTSPTTDSCENHICQNNGTCLSYGRSTSCLCPFGYSGALCEIADGCHPNPCENDGICKPKFDKTFKCSCLPGTTGKRCEVLRSVCAKTMRRPVGQLKYPTDESPEYSIDERCAWIIRTNPMEILNLTFTSFDIEDSVECSHDWLQIHDGNGLASQLIGRFCGKDLPMGGSILSSHNLLFFWFRSDNVTNRPGFQMSWVSQPHVCGDTLELGYQESGVIRSPGYPGKTAINRECQWELSAPYGYRFVIRIYEIVLGTRPNCTGDTLKIYDADLLLKAFCETSSAEPLRSSSNKLRLHLHTDNFSADSSFQLHYEVEPGVPHCGGIFTEPSGLIVGPSDQATCLYLIQQPPGTQIKLEFVDMRPFQVANCNLKRIEIFDGKTDEDKSLSVTCSGEKMEPIISTSNSMLLKYINVLKDDDDNTSFRAKYSRVCEFRVFGPDAGVLTTPNYPKPYLEYITCTFYIYGPANSVIVANFTDVSIAETKISESFITAGNTDGNTTISYLNDDSITYMDVYLSKTNKRRYVKGSAMELRSERNKMVIVFHGTTNTEKARGLRVEYDFETRICGGVYTEDEGSFYKYIMIKEECVWIIEAPDNKHIKLVLDYEPFLERGALLVIANTTGGVSYTLLNATTLTNLEQTFNFNVITIIVSNVMFRLSVSYVFLNAAEACSGNFSTTSGVVSSPNWPNPYRANLDCVWIITAPLGKKIELKVQNFTLEPLCSGDILEIRNGKFATSPLIGRYCGNEIPSRIPSFTNNMYLRFTTDNSVQGTGFHLNWEQTTTGCGGKLTGYKGSIHSPHYDNLNDFNSNKNMELTCDWKIYVAQGSSIDLTITTSIDLLEFCRRNHLKIYDGSNTLSPILHFNCSEVVKGQQLQLKSSTNQVLVVYTLSESSQNFEPDFLLDYETNCNAIVSGYRGIIESPNFPEFYPENQNCVWDIMTGSKNKVQLVFSHLSLEAENMECEFDYVEVWDMQDDVVLKKTHLCAELPDPINSEGNHLRIRFVTDYSNNRNGFRAEYTLLGCGEHLSKDFDFIISPSFPYSNDVDCEWYIEVSAGRQIYLTVNEFHLEADNPDCSRDMLLIKETKSSSLELFKECQMQQIPIMVTSPSNRLYIQFRTSPLRARKYFKAFYQTKQASCGGTLRGTSGVLFSPNYPYTANAENFNCVWDITVPDSYGIVLDFKDFQLFDSQNCTDASVKFLKLPGLSEIYVDKFCGSEKPSLKLIHGNRLKIVYNDNGVHGLGKFLIEFRKQCGGLITKPAGYIKSLANEECVWEFDVNEGTRISLNILQMDCYCKKTNEGLKICGNGLGFKENQFDTNAMDAVNYTMFFCEEHQSNLVFEVDKLHIFAKNINFQAKYSTTQQSCGGPLTSSRGSLASPNFPATYPSNIECTWTIQATKGSFIRIQFDSMNITKSEHCNEDYLEIREWSESKVLGLYCGNQMPDDTIVTFQRLWLKFHSSDGSIGNGFKLSWSFAHLNEIVNMTKGIIEAPPIKMAQNEEEPFAWRIMVERDQYVVVEFDQYNMGLNLYDGYDDTALLVDISPSPWRFVSSSNVAFLNTDNANLDYFKIRWSITSKKDSADNTTLASCHSEQSIKVHRQNSLRVVSPGYPQGYNNNLHCDWTFKPYNPTEHVVVDLFVVDLEVVGGCSADYLKISTSTDLVNWHQQERICNGSNLETVPYRKPDRFPKSFKTIHGTPHIKLDFVTDASVNRTGFEVKLKAKCGSNMTDSVGFISGRMFGVFHDGFNTQCIWHISVKPGKRIKVLIDFLQPSIPKNAPITDCQSNALIYDGVDEHAPLLAPGKICYRRNVTTIKMNSTNNHLTVKYNLNTEKYPESQSDFPWNLTYREYSECSEEIRLIPEASEINITSPQYPNIPHPHTDCEWRIVAPPGELIQVEFLERFDMNVKYCSKEYLELFDGATKLARSLGKFCRKPPQSIKTTQYILYMHYLTDINEPRNGFKARISISRCGSSFNKNFGTIKSPDYPATYPSSAVCDYAINLPTSSHIRLEFSDIHLPYDPKNLATSDYLEIITIGRDEVHSTPSLIYGNTTKDTQMHLPSNKAVIRFHTFMKRTQYRGFMLKYNSNINYCKYMATGVSGPIVMHLISRLHFDRTCTLQISVPKKRRVRLEFLNMEDVYDQNNSSLLSFKLYNNLDLSSEIATFTQYTFDSNAILQSSDNIMLVRITVPKRKINFKSLRAYYSSTEESPCPADIDDDNQSGLIDIRETQPTFNGSYFCTIKIKLKGDETLVFNISTVVTETSLLRTTSALVLTDGYNKIPIRTNRTHLIRGQSQKMGSISLLQNEHIRIHSLKLSYRKYACGGVVIPTDDMIIKQPQLADGFINNGPIVCVWTLIKSYSPYINSWQDYKLSGNFTFTESCERESLRIFNGVWDDKEPSKTVCKDDQESELTPTRGKTFIVYTAESYNPQKTQFSISVKKTISCGSETTINHVSSMIQIDKSMYVNNQECSWIFSTHAGFYLQIQFMNRFFIENSPNCTKDYLEIQRQDDGLWIPDARFCGREVPTLYNVTSNRIQVIFRTDEAVIGDGFAFSVQSHCSLTINVTSTEIQRIVSPQKNLIGWRKQYCEYIFVGNSSAQLINIRIRFQISNFVYTDNSCRLGSLSVFKRNADGIEKEPIKHCEMDFEERAYKYLRLTYESIVGQKFTIEYSYDSCGGNVTTPTTIRPQKHETGNRYADNMNCLWYITAPADHSIAINFKYFDTEQIYDHVSIYSGHLIKAEKRVAKLSGNHSNSTPTILVEHNQAIINAISDISNAARGFEAEIVFIANCNERISLSDGNSPVTLARTIKLNSIEQYICNYRISAPNGYRIKVLIKKLQINSANSTCQNSQSNCTDNCNYLQIFSSAAGSQTAVGKFCTSAGSQNRSVLSSYEHALIKLNANNAGQYSFEIILNMEKTICGDFTDYKLGENEIYKFTFPRNGAVSYEANIHCNWRLTSNREMKIHFDYLDLQNKSQITGKCLDYLHIKGSYNSHFLCGQANGYTINLINVGYIDITFHSDDLVEGKGFQFIVQRSDACDRNYTLLSDNIAYQGYGNEKELCNDTIIVPENYTLNFYIDTLYFKNFDRNKTHFRISDLRTNKTWFNQFQNTFITKNVFTTTNAVRIEAGQFSSIKLTYIASDSKLSPGCGGSLYSNEGQFSSPSYENDRNFSLCRWDIVAPSTNNIKLNFFEFDMGTTANCNLDSVQIIEILPNNSEKILKTYCGSDQPDDISSSTNHMAIISRKSPNFNGIGWTVKYEVGNNYEEAKNKLILT